MTDFDIEVGRHDVEITFGEVNFDLSFVLTLGEFIDTLEGCYDDPDISDSILTHVTNQAVNKYEDEKVFTDEADLERFKEQLKKVME